MNRIYKVLAIVSAIIVLILCAVSYTMFAHKKNTYVESQKENDIKTSILKEAFTITLENDHICILDSMKMREPERLRKVLRDSTLQDKPMFVVRISELHCEECMRFILLKLLRLTKGTEMEKHIVLRRMIFLIVLCCTTMEPFHTCFFLIKGFLKHRICI